MIVDLPDPVIPTKAIVSPGETLKFIFFKIKDDESYPNEILLNSISPLMVSLYPFGLRSILLSPFNNSKIRPAAVTPRVRTVIAKIFMKVGNRSN